MGRCRATAGQVAGRGAHHQERSDTRSAAPGTAAAGANLACRPSSRRHAMIWAPWHPPSSGRQQRARHAACSRVGSDGSLVQVTRSRAQATPSTVIITMNAHLEPVPQRVHQGDLGLVKQLALPAGGGCGLLRTGRWRQGQQRCSHGLGHVEALEVGLAADDALAGHGVARGAGAVVRACGDVGAVA
jgi:hypothetical protein